MKGKVDLSALFLVFGIITAFAAGFSVIKSQEYYNKLVPVVFCSEKDIAPYTTIKDSDLIVKKVPKMFQEQEGMITNKSELIGKVSRTIIPALTPISRKQLLDLKRNRNILSANLTQSGDPYKVAYTVPTTTLAAVGGKILPNDVVNIIGTFQDPSSSSGSGRYISKVVVPFARVIDTLGKDGNLNGLTFELTTQEVLDIEYVLKNGRITFALLPYNYSKSSGNEITTNETFTKRQLVSGGNQ